MGKVQTTVYYIEREREREVRKKSFVIKEVQDNQDESETKTKEEVEKVVEKIELDIDIQNDIDEAKRIGKFKGDQ